MPGYANPPVDMSTSVSVTPSGNISSTTVQDAIMELDSEKFQTDDASSVIFFQVFR